MLIFLISSPQLVFVVYFRFKTMLFGTFIIKILMTVPLLYKVVITLTVSYNLTGMVLLKLREKVFIISMSYKISVFYLFIKIYPV